MKLEVGMYVRTNEGIGAIHRKYNDIGGCMVKFKKGHIKKWITILKASDKIIDLIEVDDYVNGYKVVEVDREKGTVLCGVFREFNKGNIETIVTKEQFESCMYKVGE